MPLLRLSVALILVFGLSKTWGQEQYALIEENQLTENHVVLLSTHDITLEDNLLGLFSAEIYVKTEKNGSRGVYLAISSYIEDENLISTLSPEYEEKRLGDYNGPLTIASTPNGGFNLYRENGQLWGNRSPSHGPQPEDLSLDHGCSTSINAQGVSCLVCHISVQNNLEGCDVTIVVTICSNGGGGSMVFRRCDEVKKDHGG